MGPSVESSESIYSKAMNDQIIRHVLTLWCYPYGEDGANDRCWSNKQYAVTKGIDLQAWRLKPMKMTGREAVRMSLAPLEESSMPLLRHFNSFTSRPNDHSQVIRTPLVELGIEGLHATATGY